MMEEKKGKYIEKFGFAPRFRAGMHCGMVTIGELGDLKREIAMLGDTVNATARIQEACKQHNKDILISSDLLEKISLAGQYRIESLGEINLRGRGKAIELFSVEKT